MSIETGMREVILAWGQVNSLAKRFALGARVRSTLCMVPCHSRYIYGSWRRKGVMLKATKDGGQFSLGQVLTSLENMI